MKRSNSLLLIGVVVLVLGYLAYTQLQEGFALDVSGACPMGRQMKGCIVGNVHNGKCYYCEDPTFNLGSGDLYCSKPGNTSVQSKQKPYDKCV
jgi:hypothetical protein